MNKAIRPGLLCSLILISLALAATEADSETDHAESSSSGSKGLSVDSLSAVVFAADGKKQSSSEGKLGDKLLKKVQLKAGESVEVSFQPLLGGAAAKVQQAMLMAVSKEQPSLAAYAVAKAKKDGMHVITLAVAGMEKQLGSLGGAFDVTLLLGDPSASKGLAAPLGSLLLPEGGEAKPKLLTAASQGVSNIKPNIHHTFRPPTKGAPAVVSLAFTGLAVAPLAVLLVYLGALGVNLKALPTGSASLWVMLFHGGIAAMLGLYLLFWVHLNLATTLPLALLLGLFIAGSGYKALGALSSARIAESKAMTSGKKTN